MILLFSSSQLQASIASDVKQPKEGSLRALRANLMKPESKPQTLAAIVNGVAQIQKSAQESKMGPVPFSKAELATITVEVSKEEAEFFQYETTKNPVANLLGKTVPGSAIKGSKSQADLEKIKSLGYADKKQYEPKTFVIIYDKERCFYGLIVCKNSDESYEVQIGYSAVLSVGTGNIASR
jgi:hypothetical protein